MIPPLSDPEKSDLLADARESILSYLEQRSPVYRGPTPLTRAEAAAFVTLRRANHQLRGCIGTIHASGPLFSSVRELARSSAFADPRFPPVDADEAAQLRIEISVLSPVERLPDPSALQPGTHGALLRLGDKSAVFLPQVAVEQGWDRLTLLRRLCEKAGLQEESFALPSVELYSFTAMAFSDDYLFLAD